MCRKFLQFFSSTSFYALSRQHLIYFIFQLPEHIRNEVLEKRFPQIAQQLRSLNDAIKGGTTAVVALVVNNSLYVANVGDSRALLCQKDQQGLINVSVLFVINVIEKVFSPDVIFANYSHVYVI